MNERTHNEELDRAERDDPSPNSQFRHGGNIVEERDYTRDTLTEMAFAHRRPDVLANQLREMGVIENGDDPEDLT